MKMNQKVSSSEQCLKNARILLPNSFWIKLTQFNDRKFRDLFSILKANLNWATVSDPF